MAGENQVEERLNTGLRAVFRGVFKFYHVDSTQKNEKFHLEFILETQWILLAEKCLVSYPKVWLSGNKVYSEYISNSLKWHKYEAFIYGR